MVQRAAVYAYANAANDPDTNTLGYTYGYSDSNAYSDSDGYRYPSSNTAASSHAAGASDAAVIDVGLVAISARSRRP